MNSYQVGDKVRIKNRTDWPSPPGYPLAGAVGSVTEVREETGFLMIRLEKTGAAMVPGAAVTLRVEAVEPLSQEDPQDLD